MTWREIYEAVQKLINQTPANSQRFSTDEFIRAINDSYRSVLSTFINRVRTGALGYDVLEPLVTKQTANSSPMALPNDFWEVVSVTVTDATATNVTVTASLVPYDEFLRRVNNIYTTGNIWRPLAAISDGNLYTYPSGLQTLNLYYVKSPTFMTENDIIDGTTKPEINEKYHHLIVYGAAANLALHAGSGMESYYNAWQSTFNGELAKLIGGGTSEDKGK